MTSLPHRRGQPYRTGRRRLAVLVAASLLAIGPPGLAAAEGFEGWVDLGAVSDFDLAQMPEPEFEARFGYDTGRIEGVKAVFEAGADTISRDVEIKDAFADLRFGEKVENSDTRWHVRFGRGKKIVGWEYEDPRRERLTLRRSLVYRFLESNGLVGRDYFAHVRWREARAAIHYDEVGDVAAIVSWTPALSKSTYWGTWLLVQREHYISGHGATVAAATGPREETDRYRWAGELFAGVDPFQTEQEDRFGTGRKVYFFGAKLEGGVVIGPLMPYLLGSVLAQDVRDFDRAGLQGILGLRFSTFHERIRLAGEIEFFRNDIGPSPFGRLPRSPIWRLNARYFLP